MKKQSKLLTLVLTLVLFFVSGIHHVVNAQSNVKFTEPKKTQVSVTTQEEKPYIYVEQMPEFEGGGAAFKKFMTANLKYPASGAGGITFASFIVEKDGSLSDIEINKSADEAMDAEVIRIIKLTNGKWKPGKQNRKTVRVKLTLPIRLAASN